MGVHSRLTGMFTINNKPTLKLAMLVVGTGDSMPTIIPIDRSKMPVIHQPTKSVKRTYSLLEREKAKFERKQRKNHKTMNREVTQQEVDLLAELKILEARQIELKNQIKDKQRQVRILRDTAKYGQNKVSLYVLRLQDDCWYIGMTYNVERRFKKHGTGKGAQWTKLHKPIEIHETRTTEFLLQEQVAKLEDDLTLEYALKYGGDKVRGGGFCQVGKPHWPAVIVQNDRVVY